MKLHKLDSQSNFFAALLVAFGIFAIYCFWLGFGQVIDGIKNIFQR